ncbi:hypothetical protein Pmani_001549 [Petrolisthes manimaculis]|uniref:Uncharacterized protein n=1 Tax=Petrolisthes manimaculis TaxID=1843537 RepID=A0AAE1QKG8_9EUCA|nr:hypothetical protein Pmani_001549 [Petrolisthes manimaculis]
MDDQRSTLSLDNHRESNNTAAPINTEKRSRPLMERSNSSQMEHKPQPVPQQQPGGSLSSTGPTNGTSTPSDLAT